MTPLFLAILFIILLGTLLRKTLPDMEAARLHMNRLVIYVFLPGLIFHTVMTTTVDRLFWMIPVLAGATVAACLGLAFLTFHFLPLKPETKGAMILASSFGNVTNIGLPVLLGMYPASALQITTVVVLFEITKSSLNLTVGSAIAVRYGSRERLTFQKTVLEVLKLPPVWALFLTIAWRLSGVSCPVFLIQATQVLSEAISGIMILSLGLAIRFHLTPLMFLAIPVIAIKLFASPAIATAITGGLGMAGVSRDAAILEAAMPCQLLSFVIASRYRLDDETLAVVILITTLASFVTLPILHGFLAAGNPLFFLR